MISNDGQTSKKLKLYLIQSVLNSTSSSMKDEHIEIMVVLQNISNHPYIDGIMSGSPISCTLQTQNVSEAFLPKTKSHVCQFLARRDRLVHYQQGPEQCSDAF